MNIFIWWISQKVISAQHLWKLETFVFYAQTNFRSNFQVNFQFQHFMLHNLKIKFFDFFVKTKNWSFAKIQILKITSFQTFFLVGLLLCVSQVLLFFFNHANFQCIFPKTNSSFFDKILGKLWNFFVLV